MTTLNFLAYTSNPQNIFWFIVERNGEKQAHHCGGTGVYIPNDKVPNSNFRQISLSDLKDFPEVRAYIQDKLK